MANWQRTPPKSGMSIEEMKKRVAAGIQRRRQTGELRPENLKEIQTVRDGPGFTKKQRRVLIQAANLAIYSLANNERLDYCHAVDAINACRRQAGLPTTFMKAILEGVASAAAEASGEPYKTLDQLARAWLQQHFTPSNRVISLSTQKGN